MNLPPEKLLSVHVHENSSRISLSSALWSSRQDLLSNYSRRMRGICNNHGCQLDELLQKLHFLANLILD